MTHAFERFLRDKSSSEGNQLQAMYDIADKQGHRVPMNDAEKEELKKRMRTHPRKNHSPR